MEMERRKQRSEYKDQALGYWLDAVAQEHELSGLVLAEENGLYLASNLPHEDAEAIAARALVSGGKRPRGATPLKVLPLSGNEPLYLCVLGKKRLTKASQKVVEAGIHRILGLN
jgi:hypothetical protein